MSRGAGHQQAERHRLGVAVGELLVVASGKGACASRRQRCEAGAAEAICSMTSSRNSRQRRALTSARPFALFGGMGVHCKKSTTSGSSVAGAGKLCARSLDVAVQTDDIARKRLHPAKG